MERQQDTIPIAILPMGDISNFELKMVSEIIRDAFCVSPVRLRRVKLPTHLYNARRRQWNAGQLLNYLFDFLDKKTGRIIGVLDEDTYAERHNFVYGYAHFCEGMAVMSLARLREDWHWRPQHLQIVYNRVLRVVVHELGHTFGILHCENDCVMHVVNGDQASQIDLVNKDFCVTCNDRLRHDYAEKVNPLSPDNLFNRAQALIRHRKNREAVKIFSGLVEINPLNAEYYEGLGRALLNCKKLKEARPAFLRAIELCPQRSSAYYYMGWIEGRGNSVQAAEKWYEQAIKLDSNTIGAHKYVATIYDSFLKNADLARKHCLEYFRLGGNESDMKTMAARLGLTVFD